MEYIRSLTNYNRVYMKKKPSKIDYIRNAPKDSLEYMAIRLQRLLPPNHNHNKYIANRSATIIHTEYIQSTDGVHTVLKRSKTEHVRSAVKIHPE